MTAFETQLRNLTDEELVLYTHNSAALLTEPQLLTLVQELVERLEGYL